MSRIAGIVFQEAGKPPGHFLREMLTASTTSAAWKDHTREVERASFGWCGGNDPSLVVRDGILVAMDGAIYAPQVKPRPGRDADLVAKLYLQHVFPETLARLNGDFAIALYDAKQQTLWLARDRFGVKPLYYTRLRDAIAFGSRPRALLMLPGASPRVSRRFVALIAGSHYRYFDNSPEESPYAEIGQVPPAHWVRLTKGEITTGRYWGPGDAPELTGSAEELAGQYRELLLDAVAIRLDRARRPAFTLSGGMDSSSVLASAVQLTKHKQQALSAVYPDRTYDESADIGAARDGLVERWHAIEVDPPDVLSLLRHMIAAHDEPVATATWLSHYLLCERAAAEGFESLFGGMGGDELNAGEYEHFFYFFADLRAQGDEARLAREVERWIQYHDHPIFRKSWASMEEGLARLVSPSRPGHCLPDRMRLERYVAALNPEYYDLRQFQPVMEHPFRSYLKNRTYQDLTRETIPCCLRAEDRQTSAFGLDHFLPFLDHRLVEFMFRVPSSLKFRDGVAKALLRTAMRGLLPEETRLRIKKTGWNAPAHLWFSGRGRELLLDLVGSRAFRERGIYHLPEVRRLIDEHEAIVVSGDPKENHMMFLWQLVNLEVWLEQVPAGR